MRWTSAGAWLGQRALVTGAAGFIGGAVCAVLQEAGAEVYGTWRTRPLPAGVPGEPASLPGAAAELIARVQPAVVFHLASPIVLRRDPALYERLRPGILDATQAVAEACRAGGVRLVHVGTCEEYGDGEAPFREDQATRPVSPYSALKAAATAWVEMLSRVGGLEATVVRPFRCYGAGDHQSVVAQAARAALLGEVFEMTDGAQVREWNDVGAVARGIVACGAHPGAIGQVLNLGGGPHASVRTLVQTLYRLAGADPQRVRVGALPRRGGEIDRFWGDHSRSEALFGTLEQPGLEEGLMDVLAWHRAQLRAAGLLP